MSPSHAGSLWRRSKTPCSRPRPLYVMITLVRSQSSRAYGRKPPGQSKTAAHIEEDRDVPILKIKMVGIFPGVVPLTLFLSRREHALNARDNYSTKQSKSL